MPKERPAPAQNPDLSLFAHRLACPDEPLDEQFTDTISLMCQRAIGIINCVIVQLDPSVSAVNNKLMSNALFAAECEIQDIQEIIRLADRGGQL